MEYIYTFFLNLRFNMLALEDSTLTNKMEKNDLLDSKICKGDPGLDKTHSGLKLEYLFDFERILGVVMHLFNQHVNKFLFKRICA